MLDAQLIEVAKAAQKGDVDAFETLQLHFEGQIKRFVRRLIGISDLVDDIVQDVFISLYFNLHRINPIEQIRAYLFRIARNRCFDELRRSRPTVSLDDEPVHLWVSYTSSGNHYESQPEEVAHWLLLHLEVQEAMDKLPELQREALIMYSEGGLSYAEIADAMVCSIGTVKSRLYHAKQNLRNLLSPDTLEMLERDL
ncbi:MAG: sigma-70 family RNA polymerase sigma factor [Anaerolineae bacterium]|nr:MAG: sigma-70 family RNA polymerase sigma factor [Anaerolineae bacterium]